MSDCESIGSLVTPYVDGELPLEDRTLLERHVRVCWTCRSRVTAEQAVRDLIRARKREFESERASPVLRATCASWRQRGVNEATRSVSRRSTWRSRVGPLALAATIVLIVGGAFLYQATDRSARLMAAELTADHVKCFTMNALLHTHEEAPSVQRAMLSDFGWRVHLPEQLERVGLELVASRPCLYGQGRIAHLMYRHAGRPVSVFMLPNALRTKEVLEVMGHEAAIWSSGGRTFVLIAREPRAEVEQMASILQASLR